MASKQVRKISEVFSKLSRREKQIALAIIDEKKVLDIAYMLALKCNTISTFKKNIYNITDYSNSTSICNEGDVIDHVKFGPGIVEKVVDDKIEVIFRHEIKTLVHNK